MNYKITKNRIKEIINAIIWLKESCTAVTGCHCFTYNGKAHLEISAQGIGINEIVYCNAYDDYASISLELVKDYLYYKNCTKKDCIDSMYEEVKSFLQSL